MTLPGSYWKAFFLIILIGSFNSCKKSDTIKNQPGTIEWIVTFPDTILASTDDEMYQGQNGKIVTDDQQNIYICYFKPDVRSTVVMKCDQKGVVTWRKDIGNCELMDMAFMAGRIVVATRFAATDPKGMVLYSIDGSGSLTNYSVHIDSAVTELNFTNAFITPLADNSCVIAGTYNYRQFANTATYNYGYAVKLRSDLSMEWKQVISPASLGNAFINSNFYQGSICLTNDNKYIFEFSLGAYSFIDSSSYGLLTGVINPNGAIASYNYYPTGFFKQSTSAKGGLYNRYTNGLMADGFNSIYHYSCPQYFIHTAGGITDGFIHVGTDCAIYDTIPLNLSVNHRIICCAENNGRFLLSTFRTGVASGTEDFSANQTEFVFGNNRMQSGSFTLQNFYADFFPSIAPANDGAFLLMGKIQSFNERYNKLILIKWRPD
jgi:hypothetical protein